jgi:hypothetical protein
MGENDTTTATDIALLKLTIGTLEKTLARIEGKLDKVTDDHEIRLRKLESSDKAWAVISIVASFALTLAVKLLWP